MKESRNEGVQTEMKASRNETEMNESLECKLRSSTGSTTDRLHKTD